jgi:acyl-CoA reductase-like NAD-dependent aldehyde dehydrogenase
MSVSRVADQQLLIGGDWVGATSGESFEIRSPYTGETASTAASGTADDARRAVDAAAAAFPDWSQTPLVRRRELLERAAELMEQRQSEIAQTGHPRRRGTGH